MVSPSTAASSSTSSPLNVSSASPSRSPGDTSTTNESPSASAGVMTAPLSIPVRLASTRVARHPQKIAAPTTSTTTMRKIRPSGERLLRRRRRSRSLRSGRGATVMRRAGGRYVDTPVLDQARSSARRRRYARRRSRPRSVISLMSSSSHRGEVVEGRTAGDPWAFRLPSVFNSGPVTSSRDSTDPVQKSGSVPEPAHKTSSAMRRTASGWPAPTIIVPTSEVFHFSTCSAIRSSGPTRAMSSTNSSGTLAAASCFLPSR